MRYASPGEQGSLIQLQKTYGNFINGEFVTPVNGSYFTNTSPVNGSVAGISAIGQGGCGQCRRRGARRRRSLGQNLAAAAVAGAAQDRRSTGAKSGIYGGERDLG